MFLPLNKPPQWLLDGLLNEEKPNRNCPDCGVAPGVLHQDGCDVDRCSACGGQRLSCGCEDSKPGAWDGLWPGIKEAYEKKYVVYDTATGQIMFDLNRLSFERQSQSGLNDKEYAKQEFAGIRGISIDGWA